MREITITLYPKTKPFAMDWRMETGRILRNLSNDLQGGSIASDVVYDMDLYDMEGQPVGSVTFKK